MLRFLLLLSIPLFLCAQDANELVADAHLFSESLASTPILEPAPPLEIKKTKSSSIAVALSSLLPGLGHYYLGETRTANELLGGALLTGTGAYFVRNDPHLLVPAVCTVQAIGSYSVFAAYRDTQLYNGTALPNMPRENFKQLSAAPFQWRTLKKPEVWGALLGALGLGATLTHFVYSDMHIASVKPTTYVQPFSALPIAIGEESLFRGFLLTSLEGPLPTWGAITLSSLLFGAAHIPNALLLEEQYRQRYYTFSLPLITGLGAYMGWLTHKNHSLKESVALHMWYDFTLMSMSAIASAAAIGIGSPTHLHFSFEF